MARPRVWVNHSGKVVKTDTGISYNRARGRFYIIRFDGNRQEFRTWDEAHAALATARADSISAEELARTAAVARYRSDMAAEKIYSSERFRTALSEIRVGPQSAAETHSYAESVVVFAQTANNLADQVDVPRMRIDRDPEQLAAGPRLSHLMDTWEKHKTEEEGRTTQHHRAVKRYWMQFVKQVGNIHLAQLSPAHFRKFHGWVARNAVNHMAGLRSF